MRSVETTRRRGTMILWPDVCAPKRGGGTVCVDDRRLHGQPPQCCLQIAAVPRPAHSPQPHSRLTGSGRRVQSLPLAAGTAPRTGVRRLTAARLVAASRGGAMFNLRDLFQWERFITPSIIKIFYWLAVGISALAGFSGMISGLTLMALHPLGGIFWILASIIGVLIGVIFARIVAEFVLIMFRINEHLGAIRQRGQL
jgi:Domain of unknown function (DUF4282)